MCCIKKGFFEKQYGVGLGKQLFQIVYLFVDACVGGCADGLWLLVPSIGQGSS